MTAVGDSSSADLTVLGWKHLYLDLDVGDTYPTDRFANTLRSIISGGSIITALDFSGIQQLTDDVFFALKKVISKTKLRETLKRVYCTGCVHITDLGVSYVAQSLPSLQEIRLDGCRLLTGASIVHLQRHCPQLCIIDMSATSVTWTPNIGENLEVSLNGCSVLPADVSLSDTTDKTAVAYEFQNKLIIMLYTGCKFDVVDFLSHSDGASFSDKPPTASSKRRLNCMQDVRFEGVDEAFNVFTCRGNYSLLSLSFTPESIFMVVIDPAMENPQLHIMNRISAIRSAVPHCGIIVLGLVNTDTEEGASSALVELGEALDGYLKQQNGVLENHLQHDAFDSVQAKSRDFDTQLRYGRSLRASQSVCQVYIFSVNQESKKVSLKWPEASLAEEKPVDQNDETTDLSPKMAARTKWINELDNAKARVSRLNKIDLSELRSLMRLPDMSQRTLDAMSYLLTNGRETNYRAVITKFSFLNDMLNFNVESVPDTVISHVKEVMGDLLLEDAREKVQSGQIPIIVVIHAWVYAVYGYVTNCLHSERLDEELKKRKERWQRRQIDQNRNSMGPAAIIRVCRDIVGNLYEQKYVVQKVRQNYVSLLRSVEQFIHSIAHEKVVTLAGLRSRLNAASGDVHFGKALSDAGLGTIVLWLSIQGKVMWIRYVSGQPVILNVPWFIGILAELRREKSSCYQRNGSTCTSLPPNHRLITKHSISTLCAGLRSDQIDVLMSVLTGRGILVEAPRDFGSQEVESSDIYYYTFLLSSEKPFLRTGPDEGVESFSEFKEKYWPSIGTASWLENDVKVGFYYSFTTGFPVNMVARIVSEWSRLGTVSMIYRSGALARVGAVEILLRHDIHGTMLYNGLSVEARTTSGWTRDMADHSVISEYIAGALGKYLLVIEYIISQYPELHIIISMICRGSCAQRGMAGMIPISELPRQMGFKVRCSDCTDEGVPQELSVYYAGRQHFLPFHDWRAVGHSDNVNAVSPYAKCFSGNSDDNGTVCQFCGICFKGSLRLWEMEKRLCPTFIVHSAKFLKNSSTTKHQALFQLRGNLLTVNSVDASFEKRKLPRALVQFPLAVNVSGFTELSVTVLQSGFAQLVIGREFVSRVNPDKLDANRSVVIFDLESGRITSRDVLQKDPTQMPVVDAEPIGIGGTLTMEVVGNKSITVTDSLAPDLKQTKYFIEIRLKKNGQTFYSGNIDYGSRIGLLVQASKITSPMELLLNAPSYPCVRAHDFPLGSSILYRSGNSWTFGCIVSTANGTLAVSTPLDVNDPTKVLYFKPGSSDITTVGHYSDGMSIIVGKEPLKNINQFGNHVRSTKMWPAPRALFRELLDNGQDQYSSLNVKLHESKWCPSYNNWPEVLEQAHEKFRESRGKNQRQRNDVPFVVLPANLKLSTLLNPIRQVAHDWSAQQIFPLCRGSEWSTKNTYQRDTHFLDVKPVDVSMDDIDTILQDTLPAVVLCYYCMENRKNILPFPKKTFPASGEDAASKLFIEGLSKMMLLYRSTFLLMQAMVGIKGRANKSKVKSSSVSLLKRLLSNDEPAAASPAADQSADSENPVQPTGLCSTHFFILKKSGIQSLVNTKSNSALAMNAVDWMMTMKYSPSVLHIEVANVPVVSHQFKRLLMAFTFLEGLNLNNCGVVSLTGIGSCPQLRHIIVRGHQLTNLPDEMSVLANSLENLDLSNGPLSELPAFLCDFHKLLSLNVCNTLVSELPSNIGRLVHLRSLDIGKCPIRSLPESVRNLRCLESLRLHGIPLIGASYGKNNSTALMRPQFDSFMESCVSLAHLEKKEVDGLWARCVTPGEDALTTVQRMLLNKLLIRRFPRFGDRFTADDHYGGMPPQIFGLNKLRSLSVTSQAIRFVPREIGGLTKLSKLLLNDNPYLEEVSGEIGLCKLIVLNLNNCPSLRTPPKEIRDQGMKTVIAYLKRLSQGSKAVFQTKLMVVGLGGVGKTSLVRSLMSVDNRAPDRNDANGITDGIDISNWSINRDGQTLTYSVWDFAGQTVYYNTHQFFLSRRGVYILAWNTRLGHEHAGLDFWLSSIACHCPGVPVFIVGTHADQITNPELPHDKLLTKFPNISGFFTVSSKTGQGIQELMGKLVEVTLKLPYIGELVPEAWLNLERSILSKRNQTNLLDWNTIIGLAQTAGIYGTEVNQAVSFLHDLGTLQHFDSKLLRDRVIINPQWIVDVMASLVSVQNTVIKDGRLRHKDISIIWKNYPKEMHRWLLKLTEVFDLTFPLPNEEENIVPCLLSPNETKIDWPEAGIDGMRRTKSVYKFECLPTGLFNRAQVRLYEFSESSTMWKAGSLLKKNGHLALFQQTSDNQIVVQVHGARPENILLMVHEVIEGLISDFFTGIIYEYKIPCPHCLDANVYKPTMFSSKTLRRAIDSKALFLQCHKQFHALPITEVQSAMLPQSAADYDLQLQKDVFDLKAITDEMAFDLCFIYCETNVPSADQEDKVVHPSKVYKDLTAEGYRCWYVDDIAKRGVHEIAGVIKTSKLSLVFISNEFVSDPLCQRLFHFVKDTSKQDFILLMVGSGREWRQSNIGAEVSDKVFVNLQNMDVYEDRMNGLKEQIEQKLKITLSSVTPKSVFISYCWLNSATAVSVGQARNVEGAASSADPRELRLFLEENDISCWLDVDQVGRMGLFEDIAEGMKNSKVVVAFISSEYAKSENCKMEFRFAHISLKKPIILAVVGTGFEWESTEIGMLSLGYPKLNMQLESENARQQLLSEVRDKLESLADSPLEGSASEIEQQQKEKAFKELYEVVQRKFLRQLSAYVDDLEAYPRLFVFDFIVNAVLPSEDDADEYAAQKDATDADDETANQSDGNSIEYIQSRTVCVKALCEFEGGWHCVDEGLPVNVDGTAALLWKLTAPYIARMMAIIKHSDVDLQLFKTPDGDKLLKAIQAHAGPDSLQKLRSVYIAVRKYVYLEDVQNRRGCLKRCYMPSGKHLWLCSEHQSLPRVTVLPDTELIMSIEGADDQVSSPPKAGLMQMLKSITDESLNVQYEGHTETASRSRKSPKPSRSSSPRPSITVTQDAATVPHKTAASTYTTQLSQPRRSLDLGTWIPQSGPPKPRPLLNSVEDKERGNDVRKPMDQQRLTIAGMLANESISTIGIIDGEEGYELEEGPAELEEGPA